ncbi:MAG TPA: DnaJ C-terminal domain-containing protein, partial [Opitutaceae bacterium]
YEVLGDPDKRAKYDELGPNWQDPVSAAPEGRRGRSGSGRMPTDFEFGGTGYSDFFESFFGGSRDGYGSFGRGPQANGGEFVQPGGDVEADIMVTLDEVLHGSKRKITLRRPSEAVGEDRTNSYNVTIPTGVHEGQRIRLAGQGSEGSGGAQAGDLYLRVRLARHPDFSVKGSDLNFDLDLAPWEAVLGASAKIPTLDGPTTLKVPAGTASGKQLRLRGLGLPKDGGGRGDLYATVRVQVPSVVSHEERALWEELSAGSTFKPRKTL